MDVGFRRGRRCERCPRQLVDGGERGWSAHGRTPLWRERPDSDRIAAAAGRHRPGVRAVRRNRILPTFVCLTSAIHPGHRVDPARSHVGARGHERHPVKRTERTPSC
ncbi:hypothetical protein HETIRDRAFT_328814 [Heterobasidion irregulare TC 32-1]|uniref:Uncharacterized protein n=1 Tax=Heterobasidion irregulare (strain TC 32-1) TaxID=747525 RepID=W4JTF2_HETIT|nr:uncharacterized protein HETIRDRAFT_328814 [Heterobasidion irregulare TC 32-1]ETW76827.1 hypothetical protein HETIRDRAFT_328814 [Heterobasidion irregulare TC 32-1]